MERDELKTELLRDPFQPFKLVLDDKRKLEVAYSHAVVFVHGGILIFHGIKSAQSRVAKSYEFLALDRISRVERSSTRGRPRRRKAS